MPTPEHSGTYASSPPPQAKALMLMVPHITQSIGPLPPRLSASRPLKAILASMQPEGFDVEVTTSDSHIHARKDAA